MSELAQRMKEMTPEEAREICAEMDRNAVPRREGPPTEKERLVQEAMQIPSALDRKLGLDQ